jgi:hypothetical protein
VAGCVALAAAAIATAVLFRRRAWSEQQARVVLDRAAGAGGLALAMHEASGPAWCPLLEDRLATASLPPRKLRRPAAAVIGAVAFAVAAALVPTSVPPPPPVQVAALSRVEEVKQKAEALEAEEALDEALDKELKRLEAEAKEGRFDAVDWAALDSTSGALEAAAEDRQQALANAAAAAEKLGKALDAQAGGDAAVRAAEELEAALTSLGSAGGGEGLASKAGESAIGKGQGTGRPSSKAQSDALARALEARRQALARGIAKPGGAGEGNQAAEEAMTGTSTAAIGREGQSAFGSGAPTRGGGAAPVTFGPQHEVDPKRLPVVGLESLDDGSHSELIGISASRPELRNDAPEPSLGLTPAGQDGVKAREQPLAPRHRGVVRRYFEGQSGERP